MLRHLGLIAACACILASVGCDPPTQHSPLSVTVEFGGRVVNADAGGPVANVRVSAFVSGTRGSMPGPAHATQTATSGADGTYTLPLTLPSDWADVTLKFTGPAGYDYTERSFATTAASCGILPCWAAADRPAIRMYPTLVIRPGESIDVRVESGIVWCGDYLGDGLVNCRRVVVAASPGDPVELEIVPHDSSKPMTLALASTELGPDPSVRRLSLTVPPGGVPYVISDFYGTSTATLTARR